MIQKGSRGHYGFEIVVYMWSLVRNQTKHLPWISKAQKYGWGKLSCCGCSYRAKGRFRPLVPPQPRGLLTKVTSLGQARDWGLPIPCPRSCVSLMTQLVQWPRASSGFSTTTVCVLISCHWPLLKSVGPLTGVSHWKAQKVSKLPHKNRSTSCTAPSRPCISIICGGKVQVPPHWALHYMSKSTDNLVTLFKTQ